VWNLYTLVDLEGRALDQDCESVVFGSILRNIHDASDTDIEISHALVT
jgi:hypothetical protein